MTEQRTKYHAKRTTTPDGETFHSRAEARRYQELRLLEQAGEIRHLRLQPAFDLQPAFTDRTGKKHAAIRYVADFAYMENGVLVCEDVKGMATAVYKLKLKLFLRQYPTIDFREVQA